MRILISTFFLVLLLSFTATIYPTLAIAAGITTKDITVFHPDESKTYAMGRELFSYETFSSDTSDVLSKTEITQPPEYEGLLLRKHILQASEEISILEGDFEFIFSQSDRKTKVSQGDVILIPAGFPFGFRHIGMGEGKVLVVSQSDALPKMLSEVGIFVADKSSFTSKANKLDFTKISSVAKKYGIEFLN